MPPTTNPSPSTTTSFVTVSVVRIALEASAAFSGDEPRPSTSAGSAASIRSMGSRVPIVPVEQTRMCSECTPSARAASSHVRSAAPRPSEPVAALAHPLFSTTAAARPPFVARWARQTCTGAAAKRLEVNVAAAATGRESSVATSARSRAPSGLMPLATPEATKPRGVRTVTAPSRAWATRRSPPGRGPRSQPGSPDRRPPSRGCRARPATPRTRFGRRSGR